MTFRTKLLWITSLTVTGAVALATGAISLWTRRTFERMDESRRQAVLQQFQVDLAARGEVVLNRVRKAAANEAALRVAIEAARPTPDLSLLLNDARTLAEAQNLDFLDLVQPDGSILSSAHWPARFGYRNDWVMADADRAAGKPLLARIPTRDGSALGLAAAQVIAAGDKKIELLGAQRLDAAFLRSLGTGPGTRVRLWLSPEEVLDAQGPVQPAAPLAALVSLAEKSGRQQSGIVLWSNDKDSAEAVTALPLQGPGRVLGVLLIGTPLAEQMQLQRSILWTGLLVSASGILLGLLTGIWTTGRVTRPVQQLAAGARAVAGGDWNTRVAVTSSDEIGELAESFNLMTRQLLEQRDRALQAERVAAWRELARRLAHELKNPLFPLQITVENLRKARALDPEEFERVFAGCTDALLAELGNLRTIIDRFSDFAKMPLPHKELVDLNEVVRGVMPLFQAQFQSAGLTAVVELTPEGVPVEVDREQLSRALKNLVLNALDATPGGGTLRVETRNQPDGALLRVTDSGQGLTAEECDRLFTPYYTTKRHGTGLGLAIVQSVVSDHQGRISVTSAPGEGACFTIILPARSQA